MANEENPGSKPANGRVVKASRSLNGTSLGKVQVLASTKHGPTSMIGIDSAETLQAGETLVTDSWILGARNFIVVGAHTKPMKLPGTWYVVRAVEPKASSESEPKTSVGPKPKERSGPRPKVK